MSLETNLNISPYYDDYDPDKKYYKILFRPGVALQARELTQIQDIVQNQIEKFGDHVFKSGTIISGVNFQFFPSYNYVKLTDNQVDGQPVILEGYVGLYARNSSNVVAEVINYKTGFLSTDPDTNYIYLNYINSGQDGNTTTFANGDVLTVYDENYAIFDYNVINGGSSGFSNSDTVEVISALLVNNSNVAAGETVYQTIGSNTANVYVIESNSTFGEIFVNNAYYKSDDGYKILKIRPVTSELSNINIYSSERWNVRSNTTIVQSGGVNTAFVVAKIGEGASAELTTDGSGIINDVSVVNEGTGYIIQPHVTVRSGTGTINSIDIVAQNYKAQVTVANSSFSAANTKPVGNAYAFAVSTGVIYQKGYFLSVENQTIVVNAYSSNVDNVTVGFVSEEKIVNSNFDTTLLDNSIGTSNYTAPGANRLQIVPKLEVINSSNVSSNSTFFPLVDFRNGGPYRQNRSTVYGELAKEFERRTHETSGSFIIDPFVLSTKDQPIWSNTHIHAVVDPGLAYINGKRIETQKNTFIPVRRSSEYQSTTNQTVSLNYGSYVYVTQLAGLFPFKTGELVEIYDQPNKHYVDDKVTVAPSGNRVGQARIRSLVYDSGTLTRPDELHRMYLFDIQMDPGKTFARDAKSIYYNGPDTDAICDIMMTVAPSSGEAVAAISENSTGKLVFRNGNRATRNSNGFTYSYRTHTETTLSTSGGVTITTTDTFPYGNNAVLNPNQRRQLLLIPKSGLTSTATTPSITCQFGNNVMSGVGLPNKLRAGDNIYAYSGANSSANVYTSVTKIVNTTHIEVSDQWNYSNTSDVVVARYFPALAPITLGDDRVSANVNGTAKSLNINISNNAGEVAFSGVSNVFVVYDVLKINTPPTSKTIKRNIQVKLSLANNVGGVEGPWCLGVPDAFLLNSVKIGNSSVNASSTDIKRHFYINNGQNRDYYGHAQLVCIDKNLAGLNSADWLLVDFSVFDLPSAAGGFFTVDSYAQSTNNAPISVLGNNYVFGAEIPDFMDTTDEVFDLIDCIDFRPRVNITANLTSNVAAASINPANTIAFGNYDKLFPTPDSLFLFNSSFYLGRKDRVVIDEDSNISVIEGRPGLMTSITPPDEPARTMTVGILNVVPYPSTPRVPDQNIVYLASKRVGGTKGPIYNKVIDYTVTEDLALKRKVLQPRRYTMADIGKLERRIEDLEYYTNLNLLEKDISDLNIPSDVDPTKNRFKNGFVVDPFDDYGRSLKDDPEFSCVIEQKLSALFPSSTPYNLSARFNIANTVTRNNLRLEDGVGLQGLNRFGESVLMLPENGTANIVVQDKFTSLVSGVGNYQFVGDMTIAPANMRVLLKAELFIPGEAPPPVPVNPPSPVVIPQPNTVALYSITPDRNYCNEGDTITYNVALQNVPNGTTLYWTTRGTVSANDLVDGLMTGSFVVNSASHVVQRAIKQDALTEPGDRETIILDLRTGNTTGQVRASSETVYILDTSNTPGPTYNITPNKRSVNEGGNVIFTVTTTNVADGTVLYYTTAGTVNANDFAGATGFTGNVTVTSGTGTITRVIAEDVTTEGNEEFYLDLRVGSISGNVVDASETVIITDTSLTPLVGYSITPNTSVVNEGSSVLFTASVQNAPDGTYYYSIDGTVTAADFTDNTLTGTITISGGTGTVVKTLANDITTEGEESFTMSLRSTFAEPTVPGAPAIIPPPPTPGTTGTVRAVSRRVTVNDTSRSPTYDIVPNVTSVNEGGSVIWTVTTANVANNTTLYYTMSGTATSADFATPSQFTGSVVINNNTGTFTTAIATDAATEGNETLIAQLRTGSTSGTIVDTSSTVTIVDVVAPTYSIEPNVTSVNEGQTVTFTARITNASDGTYYWSTNGTVNASDFTDGTLTGTITISGGTGTVNRSLANDVALEGIETFTLTLRSGSTSGTSLATSRTVTVNDTSIPLVPTYDIVPNVTSINEGDTITYTVSTTNVSDGTRLYYTFSTASTATSADLSNSSQYSGGEVIIFGNRAQFTVPIRADVLTEGTEVLVAQLRTGSTSGTVVDTATSVTINDTSVTPVRTYSITPSVSSINEGQSVTFNVRTTNVPAGTVLYWSLTGIVGRPNLGADDFTTPISGSVTIGSDGTASFVITAKADLLTEPGGNERFNAQLYTGSDRSLSSLVATSSVVDIVDVSLTPVPTYRITPNKTTVNEIDQVGVNNVAWALATAAKTGNVVFTVTTTNVVNGTQLRWELSGTGIDATDFNHGTDGIVTINNNTGTFTVYIRNDTKTEGNEKFIAALRDLNTAQIVAQSVQVTIVDNSIKGTDPKTGITPTPPPGSIMCSYLAEKKEIPLDLGRADNMYGQILKRKHPVVYRGYLYYAKYNLDVLEGKTDVCPFPFNFIKSSTLRTKFNFYCSNMLLMFVKNMFVDASEHMAYKVGLYKTDNLVGNINMKLYRAVSGVVGLFAKDPDVPHNTVKATTALVTTMLYVTSYSAIKLVSNTVNAVRNLFRKNK